MLLTGHATRFNIWLATRSNEGSGWTGPLRVALEDETCFSHTVRSAGVLAFAHLAVSKADFGRFPPHLCRPSKASGSFEDWRAGPATGRAALTMSV